MSNQMQPTSAIERFKKRAEGARARFQGREWDEADLGAIFRRFTKDNRPHSETKDQWTASFINRQTRGDKPGMYDLAIELMQEAEKYARLGGQAFTYKTLPSETVDSPGFIALSQAAHDTLEQYVNFRKNGKANGHHSTSNGSDARSAF